MLRRILLPLASDPTSEAAADYSVALARRYNASITSLAVVDLSAAMVAAAGPGFSAAYLNYTNVLEIERQQRDQAASRLDSFVEKAKSSKVKNWGDTRVGIPWRSLADESRLHDLIVVGRDAHFSFGDEHKQTPGRTLKQLLDHSSCPVLCVSKGEIAADRIVVGLDGRSASLRALRSYVQTAILTEAEVILVHYEDPALPDLTEHAREYLHAHQRWVRAERRSGKPTDDFAELVREFDADIAVVGAHGKGRLAEWVMGSTTRKLLEDTDVALFVEH